MVRKGMNKENIISVFKNREYLIINIHILKFIHF